MAPIPGQKIEEAAAHLMTKAGESLLRGLERVGGAALGEWFAKREAKAEAARMAIETTAKIERGRQIQAAGHQSELENVKHDSRLQRRLVRLCEELDRQQENFEAIAVRALELTERNAEATQA